MYTDKYYIPLVDQNDRIETANTSANVFFKAWAPSYQAAFTVIHTTIPCVFFLPENVSDSQRRSTRDLTGKKRLSHLLVASAAILKTVINAQ